MRNNRDTHDPMCPTWADPKDSDDSSCPWCFAIRRTRVDERKRAARRAFDGLPHDTDCWRRDSTELNCQCYVDTVVAVVARAGNDEPNGRMLHTAHRCETPDASVLGPNSRWQCNCGRVWRVADYNGTWASRLDGQ